METPPNTTPSKRLAESDLFREQAIIAAAGSQFGDPLDTYWRGIAWFIGLSIALMAALVVVLALVPYSPGHRVSAFVDVPGGLVRIGAPVDSRVLRISAKEGARVRAGDQLAVLNSDIYGVDGDSRRSMLQGGLATEQASLAKEVSIAREEVATRKAWEERMLEGLRSERKELLADLSAGRSLLASLQSQSEQIDKVAANGFVSQMDAARKRDEVLAQQSRLATSRSSLARIDRDMAVVSVDARISETKLQALIEGMHRASEEIGRTRNVTAVETEQVIRAPIAGTVSSALIAPGQSVVLGQPLFTLAKQGAPMIIRVLVPQRAAGYVREGVRIKVYFAAYPREKFGDFDARIDNVTTSPLLPRELVAFSTTTEPAYLASATLLAPPPGARHAVPALKPGMLATAVITIEERSALAWLFEPLLRGFRDSADGSLDRRSDS